MAYEVTVEWGDCDAASIIFYPHYFRWFDASFQKLLRERGLDQRKLQDCYGIAGTALVDTGARFKGPATYGDALEIVSELGQWQAHSFVAAHKVYKSGRVIVEGFEKRVWLVRDAETGALSAQAIPRDFRDLFAAPSE